MAIDIHNLTIVSAREKLLAGEFSAVELAKVFLERIKEKNDDIFAYVEVFDDVLEQAEIADKVIAEKGADSPVLTGIPLAIKDNILIEGKRSSAGSKMLENHTATYDAFIIQKLRAQGAVLLGRTNMDEFAMGSSTETSAFGKTRNPHDSERVPGGSSGGSAAAVAAGLALGAFGSDTGGSIRQPASFCGVVGMKPTYGAVSRSGLMAMASSLDQIGPFARTTQDAALLHEAVSGYDPSDSTSVPNALRKEGSTKDLYTIGVPEAFLSSGVDKDVLENFRASLQKLADMGHTIQTIDLPHIEYALPVYYIIMPAEASTNLARYDGIRYGLSVPEKDVFSSYEQTRAAGFGKEVRRRIMLGAYVLSAGYYDAYYNKAVAVRKYITDDLMRAFESVDVIATPTTPTPAFRSGEHSNDPVKMYLADIFTVPANIAGMPAISVPSGYVDREKVNLPLGMHMLAPRFEEQRLFDLGKAISQAQGEEEVE